MERSRLKQELIDLAAIMCGNQLSFYQAVIADAHDTPVVPLSKVFTAEEIELIRSVVRPQAKMCYRNAHMLTSLFPSRTLYVEGKMSLCGMGFGIDHAWNRVGDCYVDITAELALGEKPKEQYLAFGEYPIATINRVCHKKGTFGEIYKSLYIEGYGEEKEFQQSRGEEALHLQGARV